MSDDKVLDVIKRQNVGLELVIAERDKLRTERDELRQHLENLAPGSPDAHACLRRIYNDPEAKDSERRSAATAAINFEKAKPAATVNNVLSFERHYNTLEQNWQKLRAERAKVIEAKSKPPLDLDAEPSPTILGNEPDPAA
jgi:hypothetical protein